MRIDIKPLSVNEAWQGKRFRTDKYRAYQKEIALKLKPMQVGSGKLSLSLCFGLSSKNADIDNPIKNFVDCLQVKYNFNDRQIYKLTVEKVDVPKGKEFIEFTLEPLV